MEYAYIVTLGIYKDGSTNYNTGAVCGTDKGEILLKVMCKNAIVLNYVALTEDECNKIGLTDIDTWKW